MTGEVASDWGLADRGTIEPGKAADLVLFDLSSIRCGAEEFVDDFPGEASRYIRKSEGYDTVIVNGQIVFDGRGYTEQRPGQVV